MDWVRKNLRNFGYVLGVLALIFLVIKFQERISEMTHLERELKLIQTQGTQVMHTQEALLTQVAYATSDEAVKEWAYSQGRWYLPNETPILLVPAGGATPEPYGVTSQPVSPVPNWQVWWTLFFGPKN